MTELDNDQLFTLRLATRIIAGIVLVVTLFAAGCTINSSLGRAYRERMAALGFCEIQSMGQNAMNRFERCK